MFNILQNINTQNFICQWHKEEVNLIQVSQHIFSKIEVLELESFMRYFL